MSDVCSNVAVNVAVAPWRRGAVAPSTERPLAVSPDVEMMALQLSSPSVTYTPPMTPSPSGQG